MTTKQEEERLYVVAGGIADVFTKEFPLHKQEALLHEVCHAVALDIRWDARAPDRVSEAFEHLNNRSKLMGLFHEAHCFAVEQHAARLLGWHRRLPFKKIQGDVWKNGYSGKAIPRKDFFQMIKRFMRESSSQQMGVKAAATIMRLARKKERHAEDQRDALP